MKISVTIPSYRQRYLDEAIRSVLAQTWQDWELVIVDDHSPEDLQSVAGPYTADDRIHYYRNGANCGALNVVDNWNICLSYCTGDYVVCIGDDDRLLPCCLEEYARLIGHYPGLNVYHARTQIIDEAGTVVGFQEERPPFETCEEMMLRQWAYKRKQFLGDFLFSRKWLLCNGGYVKFPLAYCSDWATANLAASTGGIANGQVTMFEYRDNSRSISRSQGLRTAVRACCQAHRWYVDTFSHLQASFFTRHFVRNMTDMIYLDIRNKPVRETAYWLCHRADTLLSPGEMLNVCLRGIAATLRRKAWSFASL